MLTVGQELWMVPRQRYLGEPRTVKVVKVGRKYADLDIRGYRVDMTTLVVDGGNHGSLAQCYLDRTAHEAEQERGRLWTVLRNRIDRQYIPPENVSGEQMKAAAAMLGLVLPGDGI